MKKTLISTALPLLALGLCSCATAKPKTSQPSSSIHYRSLDQSIAPQDRPEERRESLYGKFVVTAVNGNTVVLRQIGPDQDRAYSRIIVEYPVGLLIPQQGTLIERQRGEGFEVREVAKSQDGQTSVYVIDISVRR